MTTLYSRRNALKLGSAFAGVAVLSACDLPAGGGADIVDTAVAAGSFSTLVAAVQAADLVDTLKSPGPFTVFAPTDDAFAALPAGTLDSLLLPENKGQLTRILTYHVVAGNFPASQLVGKHGTLTTVEGSTVRINGRDGVRVNSSTVITPDVFASNGVIHVIDRVLLPR